MKISEILTEAKKLINTPEKWCKGESKNSIGQFCAIGALYYSTESISFVGVPNEDYKLAKKQLSLKLIDDYDCFNYDASIVEFNDRPTTTHEDVMNLYDRTIERCIADGI